MAAANQLQNFPSHNVDPNVKVQKEWCMQFAQAINYLYNNNMTGIGINDVTRFQTLRDYGNGRQSTSQYMDRLIGNKKAGPPTSSQTVSDLNPPTREGNEFARKGYMNINWDIVPVIPKFKNVILGTFESLDHNVYADGIDEKSSADKLNAKWKLWVEMEFKDFFQKFEAESGVKGAKPEYLPESLQELEMFAAMGGFKLKSEMAIEEGIRYTLSISEWQEIKRKLYEDFFDIAVAGVKDYVDPMTQKVKTRYCDPAMCVIPYSQATDYANMPFAGEYVFYTIAELRATNDIKTGEPAFTEKELETIAVGCANMYGNPDKTKFSYSEQYQSWTYDGFRIPVLDCEFKSDDYKYTTMKMDDEGNLIKAYADEYGKVKDRKKSKTQKTKTLMVYKCKWVVGTDICWDYGHQFDIPRPCPSQANLSFHFYRLKGRSMCDMMTSAADSFQLSWLKLQNAKAAAAPRGIAIEYSSLTNISLANQKLSPLEVLSIYTQTGKLLYSTTTQRGYNPTGIGNAKPIQELEGGLGSEGQEYLNLMLSDLNLMRDVSGVNRIADGSSPTGQDLVGTTEIAMQATATVLKPLLSSYLTIKERCCKNIALRIQLLVKFNKTYKLGYYSVFGQPVTQVLEIGAEVNNAMFGIRIEARPDATEKKTILDAAQVAMQVGRDGTPLITLSDWLMVNHFLDLGMLKFARAFLSAKETQAMKESQQQKAALIEQQTQGNLQMKEAEKVAAQENKQLEVQGEIQVIEAQTNATMRIDNNAHNNKMAEIEKTETMKGVVKIQETVLKAGVEEEKNEMAHELDVKKAEIDNKYAKEEHGMKIEQSEQKIKEMKAKPKPTTAKK